MKIKLKWQFSRANCLLDKYLAILLMKHYFNFNKKMERGNTFHEIKVFHDFSSKFLMK